MTSKETIRKTVRQAYAQVAKQGGYRSEALQNISCHETQKNTSAAPQGCGCGTKALSPDQISAFLGYSKEDLARAPEGSNLGLGCGNPRAIASVNKGETIVE